MIPRIAILPEKKRIGIQMTICAVNYGTWKL
jgi:hypothetical protein